MSCPESCTREISRATTSILFSAKLLNRFEQQQTGLFFGIEVFVIKTMSSHNISSGIGNWQLGYEGIAWIL